MFCVLFMHAHTGQDDRAQIGSKEMMSIVSILSSRDPHLFFQRLETLAR